MAPTKRISLRSLEKKLEGVPQPIDKVKMIRKPAVPTMKQSHRSPDQVQLRKSLEKPTDSSAGAKISPLKKPDGISSNLTKSVSVLPLKFSTAMRQSETPSTSRFMLSNKLFFEKKRESRPSIPVASSSPSKLLQATPKQPTPQKEAKTERSEQTKKELEVIEETKQPEVMTLKAQIMLSQNRLGSKRGSHRSSCSNIDKLLA